MARAYLFAPTRAGGWGGRGGSVLPFGGQDVPGQRRQRCEVVAAPARGRQPSRVVRAGRRPYLVAREREWVLTRIAEKPDLTLRASA